MSRHDVISLQKLDFLVAEVCWGIGFVYTSCVQLEKQVQGYSTWKTDKGGDFSHTFGEEIPEIQRKSWGKVCVMLLVQGRGGGSVDKGM